MTKRRNTNRKRGGRSNGTVRLMGFQPFNASAISTIGIASGTETGTFAINASDITQDFNTTPTFPRQLILESVQFEFGSPYKAGSGPVVDPVDIPAVKIYAIDLAGASVPLTMSKMLKASVNTRMSVRIPNFLLGPIPVTAASPMVVVQAELRGAATTTVTFPVTINVRGRISRSETFSI